MLQKPPDVSIWRGYGPREYGHVGYGAAGGIVPGSMVLGGMALPPMDIMTNVCENITLLQLRWRAVINLYQVPSATRGNWEI